MELLHYLTDEKQWCRSDSIYIEAGLHFWLHITKTAFSDDGSYDRANNNNKANVTKRCQNHRLYGPARNINFGLSFHLHQYFVYAIIEGSGQSAQ